MGMLEMPYQRACRRYPSAGPLSGYPGDAPQWVSCCTLCAGIAFCSALRHFACRGHVLQRAAALCLQGSRSGALCCTLCAGGGVVFSAVILEMPLGGCPGDVPQRASSRHLGVPLSGYPGGALSAGMLEIPLGGILEMPLSGYPAALCVQGSRCPLWQERPGSGHPGDAPSSPGVYGIRLGHEKQHKS